MKKPALAQPDILTLVSLLGSAFGHITSLRSQHALGRSIQYPKLPPILTESLTLNLLSDGTLIPSLRASGYSFSLGGRVADIVGTRGKSKIRIEVKATAASAFQALSELDIAADYLVWVHFSNHFVNWEACKSARKIPIEFYVMKNPRRKFKNRQHITLKKFIRLLKQEEPLLYDLKI